MRYRQSINRAGSRSRRVGRFEKLEDRRLLATITVTTTDSTVADDGLISLPEAIAAANGNISIDGSVAGEAAPIQDVIRFADDLVGAISLVDQRQTITETVSIIGPGARWLSVDGGGVNGLFLLSETAGDVHFESLRLANGNRAIGFSGGAIEARSSGTLTVEKVYFDRNYATQGSAIYTQSAKLVVNNSSFGDSYTGGISSQPAIRANASATILNSTFANYTTGALTVLGDLTLRNTTVFVDALDSPTPSFPFAFVAVANGNLTIENSIVHSGDASSIRLQNSTLEVRNSFISNADDTNLSGSAAPDADGNIIGKGSTIGAVTFKMQPLVFAGGDVPVLLPTAGSPVIDAGAADFDTSLLPNETRGAGFSRAVDGGSGIARIDMGATEFVPRNDELNIVVDSSDDTAAVEALTLRTALEMAAANPGQDTVHFADSLQGSEITLRGLALEVGSGTTVQGPGADRLTINGDHESSIFFVSGIEDIAISGLTLTGGKSSRFFTGGAITAAMDFDAKLVITDSYILENNTLFPDSEVRPAYGAVFIARGQLEVHRSTVAGNGGAGVSRGGALFSLDSVVLEDVTISGNTSVREAVSVGRFEMPASLTIRRSTVVNNTTRPVDVVGDVTVVNSFIGVGADAFSPSASGERVIISSIIGEDVELGPLQFNGGPVPTHLPVGIMLDAGDIRELPPDSEDLDGDGDTTEPLPLDIAGGDRAVNLNTAPDTGFGGVDLGPIEIQGGEVPLQLLDENGLRLVADLDDTTTEQPVPIAVDGALAGETSFHEVQIYEQNAGNEILRVVDRGSSARINATYLKTDGTTASFGSSILTTPSYRDPDFDLQLLPLVTEVDVDTSTAGQYQSVLTGQFGDSATIQSTRTVHAPIDGNTSIDIDISYLGRNSLDLAGSIAAGIDRFRMATISSMYASQLQYNADFIRYEDINGEVQVFEIGSAGRLRYFFDQAVEVGSWIEIGKRPGSTWLPDSPNVRIDLEDKGGLRLGLQGIVSSSRDPESDSLTVWLEWLDASDTVRMDAQVSLKATFSPPKSFVSSFDFGDAPDQASVDGFPTLLENDGARHQESQLFLGQGVDYEIEAQASDLADGDVDDGVTFLASLIPTGTTAVQIEASGQGFVDAWIDLNRDGDWSDAGEQVFSSLPVVPGINYASLTIPGDVDSGETFARFRLSTAGGLSASGEAVDGEVEDYAVTIAPADGSAQALVQSTGEIRFSNEEGTAVVSDGTQELLRIPPGAVSGVQVLGTAGDDNFEIASILSFPVQILGGDGIDHVRFTGTGYEIDLSQWAASQIERISVGGTGNRIVVSEDAVLLIDGEQPLQLDVDLDVVIDFGTGGWSVVDNEIMGDGIVQHVRSQGNAEVTVTGISGWTNIANPFDVDGSSDIAPIDALIILNAINRDAFVELGSSRLVAQTTLDVLPGMYFDTNGDGLLAPIDALRVINRIQRGAGQGELAPPIELKKEEDAADAVFGEPFSFLFGLDDEDE